ncbi:MAG: hypothetical protein ACRCXZ_10340 [Patescibacteria group bacterium]
MIKFQDILNNAHTTNSIELYDICRDIWPNDFQGIFSADNIILPKENGVFCIINTQNSNQSGEHWLGLFNDCGNVYIFDTYNRPYKSLNNHFKKYNWIQPNHEIMEAKRDQDCGQRVLAFIATCMKFGAPLFFEAYAI